MKLTYTKLAAISTVVLTIASFQTTPANAQACGLTAATTINFDTPIDMDMCVAIDNSIDVTITDVDFGVIGVTSAANEIGCLKIATDNTVTETNANCVTGTPAAPAKARIVMETAANAKAGILAIAGAYPAQLINMDITVANEKITCQGDPSTDGHLKLTKVQSDTSDSAAGSPVQALWEKGAASVTGQYTTDASTGNLTIKLAAEISTDNTANKVLAGTCEGAFQVTMYY